MDVEETTLNTERTEDHTEYGKRVYVYFAVLTLVLATVFALKAKWQHHVPVKQISVEGISVISKDEIVRLMNLSPNVPMYDVDLTAIQKNILSNSFVKSVVIQRDAPATIRVTVEERKPAAILNAQELYYLASDGTVLPYIASTETYDIPVISGLDSLTGIKTGRTLHNADVLEALEIINAARYTDGNMFHAISEIRLRKGHDLVMYSFESGIPIIFGKGDAAKKMVKLDAFWQQFIRNNETADIQYIDIRFEDQVIVSQKNS